MCADNMVVSHDIGMISFVHEIIFFQGSPEAVKHYLKTSRLNSADSLTHDSCHLLSMSLCY